MVQSLLNEKSKLNVAAILKAEQEYHEAKALANRQRFIAGGGVFPVRAAASTAGAQAASGASGDGSASSKKSQLLQDIEKIRHDIQEILSDDIDSIDKMPAAMDKLNNVDSEVKELRQEFQKFSKEVTAAFSKLEAKLNSLNVSGGSSGASQQQQPPQKAGGDAGKSAAPAKKDDKKDDKKKDDDDIDLFGSDDEDDPEAEKLRQERADAHLAKKSKKPALVAKSMIILDVKPWDDETNVQEMEDKVRGIWADGLIWGTSKFVEVAYGIKKLQITTVVEDEKISVDWLEEQITGFEDYVQSIDIVAFNKI